MSDDCFYNGAAFQWQYLCIVGSTSSGVSFPSFDPPSRNVQPIAHMRPPHLPFRRISLPTAPTLMHRESIVSVASFDSLPEEGDAPLPTVPAIMRITHSPRKNKARPPSVESPRKAHRRRDTGVRHNDEARTSKRRKIIEEFYETERAYVDGLELVYSVRLFLHAVHMPTDHAYSIFLHQS